MIIQNEAIFYIPINKLKTGGLYWISARNSQVGIWFEQAKGFVIPRIKVDRKYLFVEYHWDTNDEEKFPFGTVKPFELIEKAPFKIGDVFFKEESYRLGFGWRLNSDSDMANELLDYLLEKSDALSEDKLEQFKSESKKWEL